MADPIPGTGVYAWYYTLSNEEYQYLQNNGYSQYLSDFKQYTNGYWYAPMDAIDNDADAAGLAASDIELGIAWFTRSTEPNWT